jgi:hypothetical protein
MYSEEDIMNALHSVELKHNKDYSKIYNSMKEFLNNLKKQNMRIYQLKTAKEFADYFKDSNLTTEQLMQMYAEDVAKRFAAECVNETLGNKMEVSNALHSSIENRYNSIIWEQHNVEKETIEPHDFCETPEEQCTMNYCDENGCQNRVRVFVEQSELPSSDILSDIDLETIIKMDTLEKLIKQCVLFRFDYSQLTINLVQEAEEVFAFKGKGLEDLINFRDNIDNILELIDKTKVYDYDALTLLQILANEKLTWKGSEKKKEQTAVEFLEERYNDPLLKDNYITKEEFQRAKEIEKKQQNK